MDPNHKVIMRVVLFLGSSCIVGIAGLLFVVAMGHTPPNELYMIVTGAISALGTLLSSARSKTDGEPITDPNVQTMRHTTTTVVTPENGSQGTPDAEPK